MKTEIKNHSASTKHFVVINPTEKMLEEAKKHIASNNARINKDGSLTVHNNCKHIFQNLLTNELEAERKFTAEQEEIEEMYEAFGSTDFAKQTNSFNR